MQYLSRPSPDSDDIDAVKKICLDPFWVSHQKLWLRSYANYLRRRGNPWHLLPAAFSDDVRALLYLLYDKRKRSKAFIKIRNTPGLLSCPVCGSPTTGTLDHYLPRTVYPEFAIFRANLVPACNHCNSSGKGSSFKGNFPERFLHPYFDGWAQQPLWLVRFVPPYGAVTFETRPVPNLSYRKTKIVAFHLERVMGEQLHLFLAGKFSTLPNAMAERLAGPISLGQFYSELATEFRIARSTRGQNSWEAAFFRGLLIDAKAVQHLYNLL